MSMFGLTRAAALVLASLAVAAQAASSDPAGKGCGGKGKAARSADGDAASVLVVKIKRLAPDR